MTTTPKIMDYDTELGLQKYLTNDSSGVYTFQTSKTATSDLEALTPFGKMTNSRGQEVIIMGNQKFLKDDFLEILQLDAYQEKNQKTVLQVANPGPIGLCAFAATTFVLSLCNAKTMGVTIPHIIIGLSYWLGGVVQILAGMWEIIRGNAFGALAFTSYGAFWLSFATTLTDKTIAEAYLKHEDQHSNAMGFYLLSWAIFTVMLTICTLKSTFCFCLMFMLLSLTFILLAIGEFTAVETCKVIAGITGLCVALLAWYLAFSELATNDNSYITISPLKLPGNISRNNKDE